MHCHSLLFCLFLFAQFQSTHARVNVTAAREKLKIQVLQAPEECDRKAKRGDMIKLHYTGKVAATNKVFDSNMHGKAIPFEFQLGTGSVIRGWEEAVLGICPGEKRLVFIPPELGYGKKGFREDVPPDAELEIEFEAVDIEDGPKIVNLFKEMDLNNDKEITKQEISGFFHQKFEQSGKLGQLNNEQLSQIERMKVQMAKDLFLRDDLDKNEIITWDEFNGPKHDEL